MTATLTVDPVGGVDLPGELIPDDRWETVWEQPCAACCEPCTPRDFGLCLPCATRYRLAGAGCGAAMQMTAALDGGDGVPVAILHHLVVCGPCLSYLGGLAEALRVAEREAAPDTESPHLTESLAAQVR